LRIGKVPKKSHFDEESVAINLQPKAFAEGTQVPLKRATLNTNMVVVALQGPRIRAPPNVIATYGCDSLTPPMGSIVFLIAF
jgi:hypothetical protein